MNFDLSVYFIADPSVCKNRSVVDVVADAVRGGATMIQLRNKIDPPDIIEAQARDILHVLKGANVPVIINDHIDVATKVDADGIHVGQGDQNAITARKMIGSDKILGLTAYTREHYTAIEQGIVDYIGTGPVYPTKTKPDKPVLGVQSFCELIQHAPVPVVGIGGITTENAHEVIQAGANGVAMMRGISEAEDVESAARDFLNEVREATHRVVRQNKKVEK